MPTSTSGAIMPPVIEHVSENTIFGKYEVGKLLGRGSFAKVYHAQNVQTSQCVAIKVINKETLACKPSFMASIQREVSIMRRLNHPHIVKIYEVLATKTKIYFAMELVKGGELFSKAAKSKFSEDDCRKYFQQLISAVGYCHARGVFHRDLKPENLLVDENGNLKVTDFGLSALTSQIRTDGRLHTICGTPAFVAPELFSKRGYDGAKLDIWCCGVVLFVFSTGYLPFNDPNLMNMFREIHKGQFRCPKGMSPDLKRLFSRLLYRNPEKRITIDGILKDPWFSKGGCVDIKFHGEDFGFEVEDEQDKSLNLNAFDIISFSSGLDLSGLFDVSYNYITCNDSERLLCSESPETVIGRVEELVKAENLRMMKKKEWGLIIQGECGNWVIAVDVYRLTESLFVVEVKRRAGDAVAFRDFFVNKLKPLLNGGEGTSASSTEASDN